MLVVQCSWEEMKRSDASFVNPIAWPSKTRERSSKMTDFFKKTTDISSKMTDIFSPSSERKKEEIERMES